MRFAPASAANTTTSSCTSSKYPLSLLHRLRRRRVLVTHHHPGLLHRSPLPPPPPSSSPHCLLRLYHHNCLHRYHRSCFTSPTSADLPSHRRAYTFPEISTLRLLSGLRTSAFHVNATRPIANTSPPQLSSPTPSSTVTSPQSGLYRRKQTRGPPVPTGHSVASK